MNISVKQCVVKQSEIKSKTDELMVEKQPPKISEPQTNSKTVSTAVTADNVITTSVQHYIVNNNQPVNLPNVPDIKSTKNETILLNHAKNSDASVPSAALEEDTFAHHKKATENMVAQWTEEVMVCSFGVLWHNTMFTMAFILRKSIVYPFIHMDLI